MKDKRYPTAFYMIALADEKTVRARRAAGVGGGEQSCMTGTARSL